MRVLLACQPPILNEVLARAIGQMPGIELADESHGSVDVVVISDEGMTTDCPPALAGVLEAGTRLIALDPNTNAARVWQDGALSGVLQPGSLDSLRRLLQPASA